MKSFLSSSRQIRWLPPVLAVLLVISLQAIAQQQPAPSPQPAPLDTVQSLKVIPLAGNGEMNDLERHVMAPLVVQVLDQNSRPVEGADVVFRFPVGGPTATFPNQRNSQTARTNADGQAAAVGWAATGGVGTFRLLVTASRGNEQGQTSVTMTNVTRILNEGKVKNKHWWSSKWGKIGIIAGAAAVVAVVVLTTRNDGSSTTTITAVPGFPTIGGSQ
jgi:hypothetical protein